MDFFSVLSQVGPTLTAKERNIAAYLTTHAQDATHLTIRELAQVAGVSASAVVRFVHALGYERFSQMMISLARADAVSAGPAGHQQSAETRGIADYAANLERTVADSVHQAVALLMENSDLARATELMQKADMIYLYGVGSSGVIAQELMQKLLILGKNCFFQSDSYLSAASVPNVGASDVVVGISYSGRNQAVLTAVENAKKQGAPVIAITRAGSRLARLADACMRIPLVPELGRKGENLSRYAQSVVLDMLFYGLS